MRMPSVTTLRINLRLPGPRQEKFPVRELPLASNTSGSLREMLPTMALRAIHWSSGHSVETGSAGPSGASQELWQRSGVGSDSSAPPRMVLKSLQLAHLRCEWKRFHYRIKAATVTEGILIGGQAGVSRDPRIQCFLWRYVQQSGNVSTLRASDSTILSPHCRKSIRTTSFNGRGWVAGFLGLDRHGQ
jgi:hypothetical protein